MRTIANLFLNYCHHVTSLVYVSISWRTRPTDGGSHFRMRIILGTILIWFLVFHVCVPECSRNGSGVRLCLWVQEKFVYFRQGTQNAGLCPAELLGQFFSDFAFNLFRSCLICSWLILGTDVFRDWPFRGCCFSVSRATAANFRLFLNVAIFLKGKCYAVMETELVFICFSTWEYNKKFDSLE